MNKAKKLMSSYKKYSSREYLLLYFLYTNHFDTFKDKRLGNNFKGKKLLTTKT